MNRVVGILQGIYFCITGIWPLISISSFETVTGEKTDDWLVQTVGVLAVVIGAMLLRGFLSRDITRQTMLLAFISALAFASVDVVFYLKGDIGAIYLADAGIQALVIGLHAYGRLFRKP